MFSPLPHLRGLTSRPKGLSTGAVAEGTIRQDLGPGPAAVLGDGASPGPIPGAQVAPAGLCAQQISTPGGHRQHGSGQCPL